MMFSVADKRSFGYIANRIENVRKEVGDLKPIYIIANKTDIIRFREVSSKGKTKFQFAIDLGHKFVFSYMYIFLSWKCFKVIINI